MHFGRGEYENALACFGEMETIARGIGDREGVTIALTNKGNTHLFRGEYDQALDCYAQLEMTAREIGDRHGIGRAVGHRGIVHSRRGDLGQALACYAQWETVAREIGDRRGSATATAIVNRGLVYLLRGEFDEALTCCAQQEAIARDTGDRRAMALVTGYVGLVHARRCNYEDALACYAEQEAIARDTGDRAVLCSCLMYTARALLGCSRLDQPRAPIPQVPSGSETWCDRCLQAARRCAAEANAIARDLGVTAIHQEAELIVALVEHAEGQIETAREQMLRLLTGETREEIRGEHHYWLWKLGLDSALDHRAEAERIYSDRYASIPDFDFKLKLDELRAAAATTP